jgi:hypothetical protein
MPARHDTEHRVYRLATLLTGQPLAATRVIEQVVDAQPDLTALDGAHLDRLTVLRSREIIPATIADDRVPAPIAAALAGMTPQQREAWVFTHVDSKAPRDMARAMDCSVTAAARHLELAEAAMSAAAVDAGADPAPALRAYLSALEVPEYFRTRRRRRARLRRLARVVMVVAAVLALAYVAARLLAR